MSALKTIRVDSYEDVFNLLKKVGKHFIPTSFELGDRDMAVIKYKHGNLYPVEITISLPKVIDFDDTDPFSIQIIKGIPRRGILEESIQSRRISRKTIWNSNIYHITKKMEIDEALDQIDSGKWYLHNFYFFFYDALYKACESIEQMSKYKLDAKMVQSCVSSNISNLLSRLELVKSDTHIHAHYNTVELGYIGMDQTQGDLQTKIQSEIQQAIKNKFLQVAIENNCDLVYTSKNHPGRVVGHGFNELYDQYTLFPNLITQKRVGREAFSSLSGCIMLNSGHFTQPLVYSDLGKPQEAIKANTIKFVNCAYVSFSDIVPLVDGKPLNADAILGTKWITCTKQHLFGSREEETDQQPFDESITEIQHEATFPEVKQPKTTVISKPVGGAYEQIFSTQLLVEQDCTMSWKAANEAAIKGMVLPSNIYLLEKRPNENFYRPIFLVFSSDSLIKKQGTNSILRMMISRLSNEPQEISWEVTRDSFIEYKDEVMGKLKEKGDSGVSKIFLFIPSIGSEEIPILHYQYTLGDWSICENKINFNPGNLVELTDEYGNASEAYCGEMSIMRMATDSEYGNSLRHKNLGIKRDVLMRAGSLLTENIPSQEEEDVINSLATLYKVC